MPPWGSGGCAAGALKGGARFFLFSRFCLAIRLCSAFQLLMPGHGAVNSDSQADSRRRCWPQSRHRDFIPRRD